jgi:hypothetical protein
MTRKKKYNRCQTLRLDDRLDDLLTEAAYESHTTKASYVRAVLLQHLESDILRAVQKETHDALLQHAPAGWSKEKLEQIERILMDHTRDAFRNNELRSKVALQRHTEAAVAETKKLIRGWRKSGTHSRNPGERI